MIIESVIDLNQQTTPTLPVSFLFRCSLCCSQRDLESREFQIIPMFGSTIPASFLPSVPTNEKHYWLRSDRSNKPSYFVFSIVRLGLFKRQKKYFFDQQSSNSKESAGVQFALNRGQFRNFCLSIRFHFRLKLIKFRYLAT